MKKLILLDANSLVNRAFYAIRPLTLKDGTPSNAIYGFMTMLSKIINDTKPDAMAAAFDLPAPTFRHKKCDFYKGKRSKMPDELAIQIPLLKNLLKSMGICVVECEGYEADDIIGTLCKANDVPTVIVTGDRDSLQLVDDKSVVWLTKKGISDVEIYDVEKMNAEYGSPRAIVDLKALMGDSSDNIPGAAGIGKKTAQELLANYCNIKNIYAQLDEIKASVRDKLIQSKEMVELSYELATIDTNAPINVNEQMLQFRYPLPISAKSELEALEMKTLTSRLLFEEGIQELSAVSALRETIESRDEMRRIVKENAGKKVAIVVDQNIHIAFDESKEYVFLTGETTTLQELFSICAPLFVSFPIVFDYKSLKHTAASLGVAMNCGFDVLLASYLINSDRNYKTVMPLISDYGFSPQTPAAALFEVEKTERQKLEEMDLTKLYETLEVPLTEVLYDMEKTGFCVDRSALFILGETYAREIESLTSQIYFLVGKEFNLNSSKQLSEILFTDLGLRAGKKNKSGYSASADVLSAIVDSHPVIPLILRYRKLQKIKSTYIDAFQPLIDESGRIHTVFKQTVTTTGRLSSVEPNLQNIPVRTEEGSILRKMFTASEGNMLVCCDYSQIELRLLAHFSGDEKLIEAYRTNDDIHVKTAAEVFGVAPEQVTSSMRRAAKAVNFGIIYGISDFGLAHNLAISSKQAKEYIERYFATYPKVKSYMDSNIAFAKEHGYSRTLFGRVRYIPELKSSNFNLRSAGERIAMNMPLQGTAADIIKIAMLKTAEAIKGTGAKLILQVHDELIIDSPADIALEILEKVKNAMENAVTLEVPLVVSSACAKNWLEAKE